MSQGKNGNGGEEAKGHADLSRAGAVVDKAIEHLLTNETDPLAVASALLAGSLGLLTQAVGEEATVQVLTSAIASVKNGDLRPDNAEGEGEANAEEDPEAQQKPDRPAPNSAKPAAPAAPAKPAAKPAAPPAKPLGSLGQIGGGHDDDDDDF